MSSVRVVRIVLIGVGQLGRRFCAILAHKHDELAARYGLDFRLVGVADRSGAAVDPAGLDAAALAALKEAGGSVGDLPGRGRPGMTGLDLLDAAAADVLCEASPVHLDSGAEPGLSHVRRALRKGMNVSTPNKGPIVTAYRELTALADKHGVELRFDGTVAGGLPALALGARDLRGACIERLEAVPNLCTGFVIEQLCAGATWADACDHARRAGALEGDGVWDLDSWDAAAKLVILAQTVLDCDVSLRDIPRQGIRGLDVSWLKEQRARGIVRVLATATRREGGAYAWSVEPTVLGPDHPLGRLGARQMGICYQTDLFGTLTATIEETTPLPSAATMLRDLLDIYAA